MSKRVLVVRMIAGSILGFPVGILFALFSTPLLWKLEKLVPIELAGHSGPADWILMTAGCMGSCLGGVIAYRSTNQSS